MKNFRNKKVFNVKDLRNLHILRLCVSKYSENNKTKQWKALVVLPLNYFDFCVKGPTFKIKNFMQTSNYQLLQIVLQHDTAFFYKTKRLPVRKSSPRSGAFPIRHNGTKLLAHFFPSLLTSSIIEQHLFHSVSNSVPWRASSSCSF